MRTVGRVTVPLHSGFPVADRGAFRDAERENGNYGHNEDSVASYWRCG